MFLRTAAAAVAVTVAGAGVLLIWPGRRDDEYHYGEIACSEVQRLGQDYMTGRVGEPEKSRIAEHVARCPRCGPMFRQMG